MTALRRPGFSRANRRAKASASAWRRSFSRRFILATSLSWTIPAATESKIVRQLIRSAGARLFYLPKYSPELNPIEQFFKLKHFRKAAARRSKPFASPSASSSSASRPKNAQAISPTQDVDEPNFMPLFPLEGSMGVADQEFVELLARSKLGS